MSLFPLKLLQNFLALYGVSLLDGAARANFDEGSKLNLTTKVFLGMRFVVFIMQSEEKVFSMLAAFYAAISLFFDFNWSATKSFKHKFMFFINFKKIFKLVFSIKRAQCY